MSFLLHRILPNRPLLSVRLLSLCQACSRPLPTNLPACTACSSIHPLPSHVSHHHLFGLDEGSNPFLVDLPTLKKRFRDAQAACHPDTWASKSPVYLFLLFPHKPVGPSYLYRETRTSLTPFLPVSMKPINVSSIPFHAQNISSRRMASKPTRLIR